MKLGGRQVRLADTEQEAWKRLRQLSAEDAVDALELPESRGGEQNATVSEILAAWLKAVCATMADRTYRDHYRYAGLFAKTVGETVLAADVQPRHLTDWLTAGTWGPTTRRNAGRTVLQCWAWAKAEGRIAANPLAGYRLPGAKARQGLPTPEQTAAALAAATPALAEYLRLLASTGARPHELRGVMAEDASEDGGRITVPAALDKNRRGRVVVVPEPLRELVRDLRQRHAGGPLLRGRHGEGWTDSSATQAWRRCRKKAGLPDSVTLYTWRHAFITHALQAGISPADVAMIAGNSVAMVSSVYAKLSLERAAQSLDRLPAFVANPTAAAPAAEPAPPARRKGKSGQQ